MIDQYFEQLEYFEAVVYFVPEEGLYAEPTEEPTDDVENLENIYF